MPSPSPPEGYLALIRSNRNFRWLWCGQIVSLLGDWLNFVASASLIAILTESGTAVGTLFVIRMLAPFLISPLGGVLADRYSRKKILIATDLARAVIVLGFLLVREPEHVWLLYLLTGLQLAVSGFFYPARTALLPSVVTRRQLGTANALNAVTWSVMLSFGAALGGVVAGLFGVVPAFLIDSVTFLVSAFFLLLVRVPPRNGSSLSDENSSQTGLQDLRAGFAYLLSDRRVLFLAIQKAIIAFFVSNGFQVLQVEISENLFPLGQGGGTTLGLMFGISGLGTGVGPILARKLTGDRPRLMRRAIALSLLLCAGGLFLTAPLTGLGLILAGTFLRGCGGGTVWVFSTQLLYRVVPESMHGRVFGIEFAIFTLAGAVAALASGTALDAGLDMGAIITWMGILTLLPCLAWVVAGRSPARSDRT